MIPKQGNERSPPLTTDQIETYLRDGILVVDNLLKPEEVAEAQRGLAKTLLEEYGVDVHDLETTGIGLVDASSTNGAGGVLDIFYPEWKMKIATHETLFLMTCQLWREAYCQEGESLNDLLHISSAGKEKLENMQFKWHPFGRFDCSKGFMYIDRIGYRIPTSIAEKLGKQKMETPRTDAPSKCDHTTYEDTPKQKKNSKNPRPIQRSLTPHFDCCPESFHDTTNKNKWRPIQSFVSLTDNLHPNTGGFEAVPGFHREFHTWVDNKRLHATQSEFNEAQPHARPCVGEYTHLSPSHDRLLLQKIQHIPVKAGSVVFWDNRIPHGNSYRNDPVLGDVLGSECSSSISELLGTGSRAVVYCSFLPDVDLNRRFVKSQLQDWRLGRHPRVGDRWMKREGNCDSEGRCQVVSKKAKSDQVLYCNGVEDVEKSTSLTELGKRLIGLLEW
mmetsp:Transcript_19502/g.40823  ORF Transcript_19502/g.40823 Transcript_19502/m.40823 type:complete len:444 (-) Transcript_19502:132-1463(-)